MSVLVGRETRVIVQGMGKHGTFHAMACREYGTNIVGGITPGKGGTTLEGFPMFNTVHEAVRKTGAKYSVWGAGLALVALLAMASWFVFRKR